MAGVHLVRIPVRNGAAGSPDGLGVRARFRVVYFSGGGDGCRIEGWTTAIEDGATWVEYAIEVDAARATRSAAIRGRSTAGFCTAWLGADGNGHWLVNGKPAPPLITQCHKELPQPAQHPRPAARRIADSARAVCCVTSGVERAQNHRFGAHARRVRHHGRDRRVIVLVMVMNSRTSGTRNAQRRSSGRDDLG
jgi:hypothetical protein